MYKKITVAAICAVLLAIALPMLQSQPPAAAPAPARTVAPGIPAPGAPAPGTPLPTTPGAVNLNAGLSVLPYPAYNQYVYREAWDVIFNRANLDGWHPSKTNFHGTTPNFFVVNNILVGGQNPHGFGGILLTDKKYKNFDFYMEIKPDWGCDGGLFLRTAEDGSTYQMTIDYLPGGSVGSVISERIDPIGPPRPDMTKMSPEEREKAMAAMRERNSGWTKVWKREDWNAIRVRMEGTAPHVQVWINGTQVTDFQDTANHAKGGIEAGSIGLQVHGHTDRWLAGGFHRWRVIAIKELP